MAKKKKAEPKVEAPKPEETAFDRWLKKVTWYAACIGTLIATGYGVTKVLQEVVFPNAEFLPPLFLVIAWVGIQWFHFAKVPILNSPFLTMAGFVVGGYGFYQVILLAMVNKGVLVPIAHLWIAASATWSSLVFHTIMTRFLTIEEVVLNLQQDVKELARWNIVSGSLFLSLGRKQIEQAQERGEKDDEMIFKAWEKTEKVGETLHDLAVRIDEYPRVGLRRE